MNKQSFIGKIGVIFAMVLSLSSCEKNFLPRDLDAFSPESRFSRVEYSPILGRTTVYNTFISGASTQPLTFKILNPRFEDENGVMQPAQELLDYFPVKVWKQAYTGKETSLKEIEDKRTVENRRLFEIREHSGQFVMWAEASRYFVRTRPDSGYYFDVEVSNSGGRKYFKNMRLKPYKDVYYEPNAIDPVTGQATNPVSYPSEVSNVYEEFRPWDSSGVLRPLRGVQLLFNNKNKTGNTLTFRFVDSMYRPIHPDKFKLTDWSKFVHGFNMKKTDSSVVYDVAYPIPLTTLPTVYTDLAGNRAISSLKWDRLAFGGKREVSEIKLGYNIYQQGDWEIIVWFKGGYPKFTDD